MSGPVCEPRCEKSKWALGGPVRPGGLHENVRSIGAAHDFAIIPDGKTGETRMGTESSDLIKRIHDAINRSVADRMEKDELIRKLQAENLRLRQELAQTKLSPHDQRHSGAPPMLVEAKNPH